MRLCRAVAGAAHDPHGHARCRVATLGKPFTIGGTQFDEKFGQGFYGWIGDTRVVDRALRPADFLLPVE